MKTAKFHQYILDFKRPSGTSRGVLNTKETYFIEVFEDDKKGIGECALFRGLSFDDDDDYDGRGQNSRNQKRDAYGRFTS